MMDIWTMVVIGAVLVWFGVVVCALLLSGKISEDERDRDGSE